MRDGVGAIPQSFDQRDVLYWIRNTPAFGRQAVYLDDAEVPADLPGYAELAAYKRMARRAGKVWREHGALDYVECMADDVKSGKLTSFPQAVKLKADEVVVFSWIVYKSRRPRDSVNKKVMADPMMKDMNPKSMPFDGKRMFWGGFKEIVSLKA